MINFEGESKKKQRWIHEAKKVQHSEPEYTEVILKIFRGFVTDERTFTQYKGREKIDVTTLAQPYEGNRHYKVMAWTDQEEQYSTQVAKCFKSSPIFNEQIVIPLDSPAYQYLYIELLKGYSKRDPGTSNGTIVMGRAKIRLPPWNSRGEFTSKFDLTGLNSDGCVVVKGFIELSMQLRRYVEV